MKLKTLVVLTLLAGLVSSQTSRVDYKAPMQNQDMGIYNMLQPIAKSFCVGVKENGQCRTPYPLDYQGELAGVCCQAVCRFGVGDCSQKYVRNDRYFGEALLRLTCREQRQGEQCNIPDAINTAVGRNIRGTCCNRLCRIGIQGCGSFCGDGICTDQERMDGNCMEDCGGGVQQPQDRMPIQPQDRGGPPTEEDLNALGKIACLGAEEGAKCILPKDMEAELGLTGVCCGGRCSYRKTSCGNKSAVAGRPDLVVSSITVSPGNPVEDERANVTVTVENVGNAAVNRSFWVRLRVEGDGRDITDHDWEAKEPLKPGESVSHVFQGEFGLDMTGSFNVKADVDMAGGNFPSRNNVVDELNEENNFAVTSVYVKPSTTEYVTVCGNGVCERGEEGSCPDDCKGKDEQGWPTAYLLVVPAVVAFAVVFAIVASFVRPKKTVAAGGAETPNTVEQLLREKEELEKMLSIAKAKYHKRELDEESFREIVRDNQKKIIELELKIRVNKP